MSLAMPCAGVLLLVREPRKVVGDLPRLLPGRLLKTLNREELKGVTALGLVRRLRSLRLDELVVLTDDLDSHERLWRLHALGAVPLAPVRYLLDLTGRRIALSAGRFLARDLPAFCGGILASGWTLARVARQIRALRRAARRAPRPASGRRIGYLRSDLLTGVLAGGSVGHTAGTAAGFEEAGADLFFISSSVPLLIDPARHPIHLVARNPLYNVCREVPYLAHSPRFEARAAKVLAEAPADLIYQRFDPGNCAGVALSRRFGVPLVLEFNGSEVWAADNWDRPFRWRRLFAGIEDVNLKHADLIVVVSEVLRGLLADRGIEPERILVLPNGVDPGRYRPDLDGGPARLRLGLSGRTVVGFIGTFGLWHGAPVLARAALRVLSLRPEVRFLFVGDGVQREATEAILDASGFRGAAVFTGLVPQPEGPAHLAAMDILAAPHVPNPDGTRFFGSPTKLFEYMAMGRAIVASRLEQIGEVIEDGRTGLLVPPADEAALAEALVTLVDDPGRRERLGAAARARALARHTWAANVRVLIDRLGAMGLLRWN